MRFARLLRGRGTEYLLQVNGDRATLNLAQVRQEFVRRDHWRKFGKSMESEKPAVAANRTLYGDQGLGYGCNCRQEPDKTDCPAKIDLS